MDQEVIILMGSEKDLDFCRRISETLKVLGLKYVFRVASAHKTPQKVLQILEEYEGQKVVYITVAGRSNALTGFVDANTLSPVIACPPYSSKYGGADIYSSLRVPSGIGSVVTIEPGGAALAAAKILALERPELRESIRDYQQKKKNEVKDADRSLAKLKE
ncbi:MAG: AIR carboxylase family protein [Thermoproteota archaeon]